MSAVEAGHLAAAATAAAAETGQASAIENGHTIIIKKQSPALLESLISVLSEQQTTVLYQQQTSVLSQQQTQQTYVPFHQKISMIDYHVSRRANRQTFVLSRSVTGLNCPNTVILKSQIRGPIQNDPKPVKKHPNVPCSGTRGSHKC